MGPMRELKYSVWTVSLSTSDAGVPGWTATLVEPDEEDRSDASLTGNDRSIQV